MMNDRVPRAFLSHASEDKQRFVVEFATALLELGVEVWLDKWEMGPGDSLIDKIFEEGLKNADVVIIVLSRNSVSKPWVREELNHAMVKKIAGQTKLIPVVLDDCEVPECLRSTVWERIENVHDYKDSLHRIRGAIFGQTERPLLGSRPKYLGLEGVCIGGLSRIDSAVLKGVCEAAIGKAEEFLDGPALLQVAEALGIAEVEIEEVLQVLEGRGYVGLNRTGRQEIHLARLSFAGLEKYLRTCWSDYDALIKNFGLAIVNRNVVSGRELCAELATPEVVVNHLAQTFERRGWLKVTRWQMSPASFKVMSFTPELKRWLRGNA